MIIKPGSKYALYLIAVSLVVFLLGVAVTLNLRSNDATNEPSINSYEECVAAGYPVMESYPERCMTPDGRSFTREIPDDEMVACTLDAKICPDGSAVGRVPPTCEFAPCPGE